MQNKLIAFRTRQISGAAYSSDPYTPTGLADKYAHTWNNGKWSIARDAAIDAYEYLQGKWWNRHKVAAKTRDGEQFQGSLVDFIAANDVSDGSIRRYTSQIV